MTRNLSDETKVSRIKKCLSKHNPMLGDAYQCTKPQWRKIRTTVHAEQI
jgi:hypothetical protein